MPTFKSYYAYISHIYLNGGSLKHDTKAMFWRAGLMLNKAKIVQNIDNAIELRSLFDKVFDLADQKSQSFTMNEAHSINKVLVSYYEPVVDDAIIISAFEIYAKAVLLKKRFLVHAISGDRVLSSGQQVYPVHMRTYRAAAKRHNSVKVSEWKTLGASTLLQDKYIAAIGIDRKHTPSIIALNQMRNKLHSVDPTLVWQTKSEWLMAIKYLANKIKAANKA